ncbi:hypothetical protein [uncultured Clostridium sp.]|uniref:hypothetical protein n=1 Tax=uncultured Clostridium sp. TaxID=59620 RepID=UPI0026DB7ECE|nr:hypothetical protein [uncultured Clostridium sp.]
MCDFNYNDILSIEDISEDTNFWLVRTNGGRFYTEYKEDSFIALGWNYVDSENVYENDEDELKQLKEELERIYEKKKGGTIFNKCVRFIDEMSEGDIVMVPNAENEEVFFARVGDYYEEEIDYIREIEVLKRLNDKEDYGIQLKCPYKKRRKIEVIKVIKGCRLNPNLFRALASSHGISNINKYSDFVLSSIHNLYIRNNKLNLVVNIEQTEGIDGKEFSSLVYNLCDILTLGEEEVKVTTQANINSPGDIVTIVEVANNIYDYLRDNWIMLFLAYGALAGIKIGPIQINSLPEAIMKWIKDSSEVKNKNAVTDGVKLDNDIKKLELEIKKAKWTEEKIEKAKRANQRIESSANNLRVDQEAASRVINPSNTNIRTNDE